MIAATALLASQSPGQITDLSSLQRELTARLIALQTPDGGFGDVHATAVAALALSNVDGETERRSAMRAATRLVEIEKSDGFTIAGGFVDVALAADVLAALDRIGEPAHASIRAALRRTLADSIWDEGEGRSPEDPWYGGAGYGVSKRPDLPTLAALLCVIPRAADFRAQVFATRCQMLAETNDQPFVGRSRQGGFIDTPAGGGWSRAGELTLDGRVELRANAASTLAGVETLLRSGVGRDDRRVAAALNWLAEHDPLRSDGDPTKDQSPTIVRDVARVLRLCESRRVALPAGLRDWRRRVEALARSVLVVRAATQPASAPTDARVMAAALLALEEARDDAASRPASSTSSAPATRP